MLKCINCGFEAEEDEFVPGREGSWNCPKCGHEAK